MADIMTSCSALNAVRHIKRQLNSIPYNTVYVDMVADLFHVNHVKFLKDCSSICNSLFVGIISDETAEKYKGKPITTMEERVGVVESCKHVDKVIENAPLAPDKDFLKKYSIDMVIHAHSKEEEEKYNHIYETCIKENKFTRIDYQDGISTTDIIDRIAASTRSNFNTWTEEIKELAKKDEDYNWKNGNNFLRRRREKRGGGRLTKRIAKENLLIFKKIADKNGLKFWLAYGTLLGAIREKDFIDYDNDTDIEIYFKDIPILINCIPELMEHGLNPLRVTYTKQLNTLITFMKGDELIDIQFLHNPTKYTKQLDKIMFLGEEFNIPAYVDEYLTIVYGAWRTPSKKHGSIIPAGI